MDKKPGEAMSFSYNTIPYNSLEEALAAIEKKPIATGEPVYVFYRDAKKRIRQFLAVGNEVKGNDTHPLYLGLPDEHHHHEPHPGPHPDGPIPPHEFEHIENLDIDGGIVDLQSIVDRMNNIVHRHPHHSKFDMFDIDPVELERYKRTEGPKYSSDPRHRIPRELFNPDAHITRENQVSEFSYNEYEGLDETVTDFDYDELNVMKK